MYSLIELRITTAGRAISERPKDRFICSVAVARAKLSTQITKIHPIYTIDLIEKSRSLIIF